MKLIIEREEGILYAYMETEKHFRVVQQSDPARREAMRLPGDMLDANCNLDNYDDDFYMVFDIKKPKKGKK